MNSKIHTFQLDKKYRLTHTLTMLDRCLIVDVLQGSPIDGHLIRTDRSLCLFVCYLRCCVFFFCISQIKCGKEFHSGFLEPWYRPTNQPVFPPGLSRTTVIKDSFNREKTLMNNILWNLICLKKSAFFVVVVIDDSF